MEPDGPCAEGLRAVLEQMDVVLARQGVDADRRGRRPVRSRAARGDRRASRRPTFRTGRSLAVERSGFALGDACIRPAQVVVAAQRREHAALMPVASQDYYEALGVPRDASADEIRQRVPQARAPVPPRRQQGARRRGPLQGRSPRPTRCCAIPRSGRATTGSARTGGPARTSPGAGGVRRMAFRRRRRLRRRARRVRRRGDFSDFFESLFGGRARPRGGRARLRAGSRCAAADHEAVLDLTLEEAARGRQAAAVARTTGASYRGRHPARRARRPADPARRARAARAPAAGRRATCSCGCGSSRIRASASRGATSTSISPCRRGRRRSAPTVPVPTLDGTRQRQGAGGLLQRPQTAAARPGPARRAGGTAGRPVRGRQDRACPKKLTDEERELFERLASASKFDPAEGALMTPRRSATTRTGTRLATRGAGLVGIEALAREAGLHPELVRRLFALGLLEPRGGTRAAPLFRARRRALLARACAAAPRPGPRTTPAPCSPASCSRGSTSSNSGWPLRGSAATPQHEVITWIRTG